MNFLDLKYKVSTVVFYLVVFPVFILLSILVGLRDISVGTDTKYYTNIYNKTDIDSVFTLEPSYEFLTKTFKYFDFDVFVLFLTIALLQLFMTIKLAKYSYDNNCPSDLNTKIAFLILSSLLISPIFLSVQTNALRQGVSIYFILFACFSLLNRRGWGFILWSLLALSFHYSSILFIFPSILLLLPYLKISILTLVLIFIYLTGISELFIKFFSDASGLPIYNFVKNYEAVYGYKAGVRYDFAIFTIFLWVTAYYANRLLKVPSNRFKPILSIFLVLTIPFWIFGWGNYSNRYIFNAWFYGPVMFILPIISFLPRISIGVFAFFFIASVAFYTLHFI